MHPEIPDSVDSLSGAPLPDTSGRHPKPFVLAEINGTPGTTGGKTGGFSIHHRFPLYFATIHNRLSYGSVTVAILPQRGRENLTEIVLVMKESCDMRLVESPKVNLLFQRAADMSSTPNRILIPG